ncbi:MAG: 2-amino-4-hydroxy-6-hydroxymethyldihydropteridine diphosphokinase [Leptothrix sp. (in: b-proteobacteria)]
MAADAPADRPVRAYIGLGANLGDARATLQAAGEALRHLARCDWVAQSALYRTAPIDSSGPDYLNAVVALDCRLGADGALTLLRALQAIETEHGRLRPYRNAPRTLDLDLLLYADQVIDLPDLVVPHPRLHLRAFVLHPLLELDPALRLPGLGAASAHLAAVADQAIQRLDT